MDIRELNTKELNALYELLCKMEVSIDKVLETRIELSIYAVNELKTAQKELQAGQCETQKQLAIQQ